MPSHKTAAQPVYTIWLDDETRTGTASELLEGIRREAHADSVIKKLTTDQYASRIIADAASFLPEDLLAYLRKESYESEHARALRYLSEMDSSGVRILSRK